MQILYHKSEKYKQSWPSIVYFTAVFHLEWYFEVYFLLKNSDFVLNFKFPTFWLKFAEISKFQCQYVSNPKILFLCLSCPAVPSSIVCTYIRIYVYLGAPRLGVVRASYPSSLFFLCWPLSCSSGLILIGWLWLAGTVGLL